jgi:hypothetical protein
MQVLIRKKILSQDQNQVMCFVSNFSVDFFSHLNVQLLRKNTDIGHTVILPDWKWKEMVPLWFCPPVFLGIDRDPKQKDFFLNSWEGFLR